MCAGRRPRYGLKLRSGPESAGKLAVLSTWMPALCVPLNGVTVLAQPALAAALGEPNQIPR